MASFDWGSLIGGALSLYGAKRGADAAKDAGNQAAAGSRESNELLRYFYDQDVSRQQPFYLGGLQAFDMYRSMLGLPGSAASYAPGAANGTQQPAQSNMTAEQRYLADNPDVAAHKRYGKDPYAHFLHYGGKEGRTWGVPQGGSQSPTMGKPLPGGSMSQADAFAKFRSNPGYQFGLNEGRGQIEASAAARGGLNSGATLKALQRYGNDYADQQGYTPYMNRLAGLFGGAQTAANNMGQAGQNYGGQMGQNIQAGANARAQSTYNANQSWQQGLQGAAYFGNKLGTNQGWWG